MSRSRQKCLHFCCRQEAVKALGSELLVTPTHPQVRLCVGLTKGHKFLPFLVGVGRGGETTSLSQLWRAWALGTRT